MLRHVDAAGCGKAALPAWIVLIVATAIMAAIVLLGPMLAGKLAAMVLTGDGSDAGFEALFTLIVSGAMLIAAIAGIMLCRERAVLGTRPWLGFPVGLLLGSGGLGLAVIYAALAGAVVPLVARPDPLMLIAGLGVVLLQVAAEEAYFRGWLQPVLARAWGAPAAVAVTALVFALVHCLGGARAPLTLVNLLLGGVWFGLLALRGGGIARAAGAHFGWNAAEQLLLGLDPNPGVGSFGSVFDLDLVGSALWGGSAEGLNASLAMMMALVVLVAPLLIHRRLRAPAPALA
jgi:membrane protease YdiL (CAAX protease family)